MDLNSSIDAHEIEKFNRTHEQWWDEKGEFSILHEINPIRIEYITSQIREKFQYNAKVLDVGCGGGLISVPLHKLGFKITGIDANKYNQKAAKDYAKLNNLDIEFIHDTVEQYVQCEIKYDVILCLEVLEHVANPQEFLKNLASMLKPGGILILSTINRTIKAYALTILIAEYVLGWVKKGTHDYSKFFKPSEIVSMLEDSDLELREMKGITYAPIENKWFLSDDIETNYFITLARR